MVGMRSVWLLFVVLIVGMLLGLRGNLAILETDARSGAGGAIVQDFNRLSHTPAPVPAESSKSPAQTPVVQQQHNPGLVIGATVLVVIILAGMAIFSWKKQ